MQRFATVAAVSPQRMWMTRYYFRITAEWLGNPKDAIAQYQAFLRQNPSADWASAARADFHRLQRQPWRDQRLRRTRRADSECDPLARIALCRMTFRLFWSALSGTILSIGWACRTRGPGHHAHRPSRFKS